jgi:hypothetical protein
LTGFSATYDEEKEEPEEDEEEQDSFFVSIADYITWNGYDQPL